MSAHCVGRLEIRVDIAAGLDVEHIQDRLSALCRDQFPGRLSDHADEVGANGAPLTVDRLVLDLGNVLPSELEDALPSRFSSALSEALAQAAVMHQSEGRARAAETGAAASGITQLQHYLQFGQAHWASRPALTGLDELMQDALAGHGAQVLRLLDRIGHGSAVRLRLAEGLSGHTRTRLAALLEGHSGQKARDLAGVLWQEDEKAGNDAPRLNDEHSAVQHNARRLPALLDNWLAEEGQAPASASLWQAMQTVWSEDAWHEQVLERITPEKARALLVAAARAGPRPNPDGLVARLAAIGRHDHRGGGGSKGVQAVPDAPHPSDPPSDTQPAQNRDVVRGTAADGLPGDPAPLPGTVASGEIDSLGWDAAQARDPHPSDPPWGTQPAQNRDVARGTAADEQPGDPVPLSGTVASGETGSLGWDVARGMAADGLPGDPVLLSGMMAPGETDSLGWVNGLRAAQARELAARWAKAAPGEQLGFAAFLAPRAGAVLLRLWCRDLAGLMVTLVQASGGDTAPFGRHVPILAAALDVACDDATHGSADRCVAAFVARAAARLQQDASILRQQMAAAATERRAGDDRFAVLDEWLDQGPASTLTNTPAAGPMADEAPALVEAFADMMADPKAPSGAIDRLIGAALGEGWPDNGTAPAGLQEMLVHLPDMPLWCQRTIARLSRANVAAIVQKSPDVAAAMDRLLDETKPQSNGGARAIGPLGVPVDNAQKDRIMRMGAQMSLHRIATATPHGAGQGEGQGAGEDILAALRHGAARLHSGQPHGLALSGTAPVLPQDPPAFDWTGARIYTDSAGLVLFWPYLEPLFAKRDLLHNKAFRNASAACRAVGLLQSIADGDDGAAEHRLGLAKLLCGLDLAEPIARLPRLEQADHALVGSLLDAVLASWPPLKGTDHAGLRETFVQRQGVLSREGAGGPLVLHVQKGPFDMLLEQYPVSLSIVRLPWMAEGIGIRWR